MSNYATNKHVPESSRLIWLGNIGLIDHDAGVKDLEFKTGEE